MPIDLQKYFQFSPLFVGSETMSDLDWERLNTKIDKLPQTLADFLADSKTPGLLDSLTQKYIQLSAQGPDVARLIRDVVIADVFIGDMPQELSRRLGIDQQLAREVANQIVSQLFTPVLEDLKKLHREKFPGRLPAKPATQQVPGDRFQVSGQSGQAQPQKYQGEELPESGGNIIDLRNKP